MSGKMSKLSGFLAFLLLLSFGTSTFASTVANTDTSLKYLNSEDVILLDKLFEDLGEDDILAEENTLIEEFVDEKGQNNKLFIKMEDNRSTVSLFVDGELEQQSIADKDTGKVTGFSNYGEDEFEKNISDLVIVENTLSEDNNMISPMAVGSYSVVASKKTVANSLCSKSVTASLYEKTSTTNSTKTILTLSKGEVITAIVATIATAVVLKSKLSATLLKEMFTGIGISVVSGALYSGFKGAYQVRSDIKDYYVTVSGYSAKYFTNKITRDYFTLWNDRNGDKSTKFLGEHISAYGDPKDYQVMLNHGILNWSNATKCK